MFQKIFIYGLAALIALTLVGPTAHAATDPDGDPAIQIAAEAYGEAGLVVEAVKAYIQESEDGETYARLDITVRNDGDSPVHEQIWRLEGDGFSSSSITTGTVEAGQYRTYTQLAFGPDVARIAEAGFVAVGVGPSVSARGNQCGHGHTSRESCEASASRLQAACDAGCRQSGFAFSGQMMCAAYEVRDDNGQTCVVWESWCQCQGTPTLTESLAAGLFNPTDPHLQDLFANPPRVEMRQLFP